MKPAKGILACDVGNSRVALGVVVDERIEAVRRVPAGEPEALGDAFADLWAQTPQPGRIAASSVSPRAREALVEAARERTGQAVRVVGEDIPLPLATDLPEPERIGTDRLCAAAMAYVRLGGACVVADFGTAITVDAVDDAGNFLGGAILPGLRLWAEALAEKTALLPKVELTSPDWVFGRTTREAIVGGIVRGARGALRELTEAYATELGKWPPLILTGGDAELVGEGYDIVHAVVPGLTLMGIALADRLSCDEPS